jgi:hypothetical protein
MTRDEAIAEEKKVDALLFHLSQASQAVNDMKTGYVAEVDRLLRHTDDELANYLPGPEVFPIQVGDIFVDTLIPSAAPGQYRVLEADEKRVVLKFPDPSTNTVEYRTAAFDNAKERGWLSRETLIDVGLLYEA